jgi:hypothetical protein
MATAIDTKRVQRRRVLHFTSPAEILADAEELARYRQLRTLGNWSAGQIFQHLATTMNKSIDGFGTKLPGVVRFFMRLLFKRRFLTRPMPPGFRLPARAEKELVGPRVGVEEGLRSLRQAVARLQCEKNRSGNPVLGPLTAAEWNQLHCRHAELHLSFIVHAE